MDDKTVWLALVVFEFSHLLEKDVRLELLYSFWVIVGQSVVYRQQQSLS